MKLGRLVLLSLAAAMLAGGCDTVDLGAPPADVNACMPGQMWFVNQIWPNFLGKDYNGKHCYDSACHGAGSKTPMTLVNPVEPPTFPLPADWANDYTQAAHEMNCSDVGDSLRRTKEAVNPRRVIRSSRFTAARRRAPAAARAHRPSPTHLGPELGGQATPSGSSGAAQVQCTL